MDLRYNRVMPWSRRLPISAAMAAGTSLVAGGARGNVAAPRSYQAEVNGSTVTICLEFGGPLCGTEGGLLRQRADGSEVVLLPERCDAKKACYVDECVPAGSYRYGLARPFECGGTSSAEYFTEVTVAGTAAACAPALGPERPAPYPAGVPWGSSNVACRGGYGCGHCAVPAAASPDGGLWAGGAALATAAALALRRRARRRPG